MGTLLFSSVLFSDSSLELNFVGAEIQYGDAKKKQKKNVSSLDIVDRYFRNMHEKKFRNHHGGVNIAEKSTTHVKYSIVLD